MADSLARDPLLQGCRMAYVAPLVGRLDLVTECPPTHAGSRTALPPARDALPWLLEPSLA